MSDYHIVDGDLEGGGKIYTLVYHFSVPDELSVVGVNLRTALSQDEEWPKTSKVPWLDQAHKNQLIEGEVLEIVRAYKRDPANVLVQDRDIIDARYTAMVTAVQNKIRDRYKFWGYDRDVP